ncbi:MAG: fatty acyl-AMP ligase [Deltaproteobacteria bacterium]|nr:fatty acyl-AMP ligase [Deltaproteobacteria bacterium]
MKARLVGPPLPPLKFGTVTEMLESAARSPERLFFVDAAERETTLSFTELLQRARRTAGQLAARGVRPGDSVALVLPTGPGFMDAFFGALCAGAVPVPLYPPVRLGRLAEYHARTAAMLRGCRARVLVTDSRVRRLLGESVAAAQPELGCVTLDALAEMSVSDLFVHGEPDDLALVQFSSGTTVDSKPVALTHRNLLSNVSAIDSLLPFDAEARCGVSWLPLYHDMGLIGCLLEALYRPGGLCLIPPELFLARPALWLRALSRHRATVSPAPNFAYGLCTKRIRDEELEGVDLSAWRLALNGAEPISPAVLHAFADRFARWGLRREALNPVYGLSEASLAVTFSPAGRAFRCARVDALHLARTGDVREGNRELASVGMPVPGAEVELRSDGGEVIETGKVGHVWVRAPSVMRGYFDAPEVTARVLREGWLDTGDLGFVLDGELHLSGRAKELVILRGANHAPQEFEECLDGLTGVRAGCVVAFGFVPEGADSEALALLVEREREGETSKSLVEQIRGRVAERTSVRPHVVELLEPGTLPRTSSGKLRRAEAARLWQAGELRPPSAVNALTVAAAVVRSEVAFLRSKRRG